MRFPKSGGPMSDLVRLVFCRCFPREMPFGDATFVGLTARMRGMMLRRWRRPVGFNADNAREEFHLSVYGNLCSSLAVAVIRPWQAIIAFISKDNFAEISLRVSSFECAACRVTLAPALIMTAAPAARPMRFPAIWNAANWSLSLVFLATDKWITMAAPSLVMGVAQAAFQFAALAAVRNRAYSLGSHVERSVLPWSEPARSARNARRVRLLYHPLSLNQSDSAAPVTGGTAESNHQPLER